MEPSTETPHTSEEYYQSKAYYYPSTRGGEVSPNTPRSRMTGGTGGIAQQAQEAVQQAVQQHRMTTSPSTSQSMFVVGSGSGGGGGGGGGGGAGRSGRHQTQPSSLSDQRKPHGGGSGGGAGPGPNTYAYNSSFSNSSNSSTGVGIVVGSEGSHGNINTHTHTITQVPAEPEPNHHQHSESELELESSHHHQNPTNGQAPSPILTPIDPINIIPRTPPIGTNTHKTHTDTNATSPVRTKSNSHRNQIPSTTPIVQKRRSIGDWDFVKTIGAGSMGQVKLAENRKTGELCAVKVIPKYASLKHHDRPQKESDESRNVRIVREAAIGKLLHHKHICQLYEVHSMTNHYYMLFEYVSGGQMLDYIIAHGWLKEKQSRKFARSIASALDYCHRNSIVHRDLKIENILISKSGDIKIIDFGLSNLFSRRNLLNTFCGSLYFAAPELLNAHPYIGPEVDVWSFGIVLYVLVSGKVPFDDQSMPALHAKIKRGRVEYPNWLSSDCKDLLCRMLVVDPKERASLSEVMHHPWMIKGYDGPPESHVPFRKPLSLPLDSAVVDGMTGFEFGSAQQIESKLTTILESSDYIAAANNWYKVHGGGSYGNSIDNSERRSSRHFSLDFYKRRLSGSQFLANNGVGVGGTNLNVGSNGTLGTTISSGSSNGYTPDYSNGTIGGIPDPTNAYHPLISIYYLVQEKFERDRLQQQQQINAVSVVPTTISTPPTTHQSTFTKLEDYSSPFDSDPKRPSKAATRITRSKTHGASEYEMGRRQRGHQPSASIGVPSTIPPTSPFQPTGKPSIELSQQPAQVSSQTRTPVPYKPRHQSHVSEPPVVPPRNIAASIFRRFSTKRRPAPLNTDTTTSISNSPNTPSISPAPPITISSPFESPNEEGGLNRSTSVSEGAYQRQKRRAVSSSAGSRPAPPPPALPTNFRYPDNSNMASTATTGSTIPSTTTAASNPTTSASGTPTRSRFQRITEGDDLNEKMEFLSISTTPGVKKSHPSARAKSWGHVRPPRNNRDGLNPNSPLPSADITDVFCDDTGSENNSSTQRLAGTEGPTIEVNDALMPSIQFPKQVFLKGFFSVQSTSTKPLPLIREDIIRVLTHLGISFKEIKGGFVCVHKASIRPEDDTSAAAGGMALSPPASPQATGSNGHWRKLSFGSGILSGSRRRSIVAAYADSSNNMVDSDLSSDSMGAVGGGVGGSDMLGYSGQANNVHTPLQFEVYIVKVPLLSLHGVQFKKLAGNSWQYKSLASKILAELKL